MIDLFGSITYISAYGTISPRSARFNYDHVFKDGDSARARDAQSGKEIAGKEIEDGQVKRSFR